MILLNGNSEAGWKVCHNGIVVFKGGRVEAKKTANRIAKECNLPTWSNVKKGGKIVEVPTKP